MDNKIKVFIFGCSKRAKDIEKRLSSIELVEIIGYVDNDEQRWGTYFFERKVYSPSEAYSIYINNEIYFLIAPQNFISINKQLRNLGVEKIFVHLYELLDYMLCVKEDIDIDTEGDVLIVINGGLPNEDNKYRSAFVHRRILAYRKNNIDLVSYGYTGMMGINRYEYDNNATYEGDGYGLSYLLSRKHFKRILIHFPTEEVMYYIEKYIDDSSQVYLWLHGYEILKWERRSFNYTEEEIKGNNRLIESDIQKENLYRRIFQKENFYFVFVSNWLKDITKDDYGMLPLHYKVIPNYIDSDLFDYVGKEKSDVSKVLLIKSNKTRMYANDLAAKAIEKLASKEYFEKIEFDLYGDGELFDDNYKSLIEKDYPNVHLHRKFLSQAEISKLHKTHGVFLCPTRQDTQGVSMCEAMSSGLVVITNKVAAIPEYINESASILCSDENYEEMADALEKLYEDRELFLQYSKNAAEFIRDKCGYSKTIQLELELLYGRDNEE